MKIEEFVFALGNLYPVEINEKLFKKHFFLKKRVESIPFELKTWKDFINYYDVSTLLFFGFQFKIEPFIIELETGQEVCLIAGGGPTYIASFSLVASEIFEFDMETMQIIGTVCESFDCLFKVLILRYEYLSEQLKGGYTSMENPFKENYFSKIVEAAGGDEYSEFFRSRIL